VTDQLTRLLAISADSRPNLIAAKRSKISLAGTQDNLSVVLHGDSFLVAKDESFVATRIIIKAT
jgi:hypothetical protein